MIVFIASISALAMLVGGVCRTLNWKEGQRGWAKGDAVWIVGFVINYFCLIYLAVT